MGLTRFVLKRPITTVMALLCLLVFGISSVFSATLEQMPEMETPMMIVMSRYEGAGPEDVEELVTSPIEDAVGTLEGVKSMSSDSGDGSSMVMLEYDYGTDMDEAYDELKQKLDTLGRELPDDVEPSVMKMNNNAMSTMMLTVSHSTEENLYDYVDQKVVPELEKISSVAEVETMGGSSEYVSVELMSDMMAQYGVTMNDVVSAIAASDATVPSGETVVGNQELSVTTSQEADSVIELRDIPITLSSGRIIHLSDVAQIFMATKERGGTSKYNGEETISISITKQQDSTAMDVSDAVNEAIKALEMDDENLTITVANDTADSIMDSLFDVAQTMVLAVIISMIIIFVFFGDWKASLIVGSSIPTSILLSLIVLTNAGFSLNIITMSALVLGVGMMVDNSIVVLESCFRATDQFREKGFIEYAKAALEGTNLVVMSIIGSTITTCVVFLPLTTIQGMSGQMFKPLGYTIVFCMSASLLSAMTIVPLCYVAYKPRENVKALMYAPVARMQRIYRKIMNRLLEHKGMVMGVSVGILVLTFWLASNTEAELMTADDMGQVSISVETRPGMLSEKVTEIYDQVEALVAGNDQVDSYMVRYNGDSGTVTAYLKDDRTVETDELADQWQKELNSVENCTIDVEASSSMSMMGRQRGYQVILHSTQYDELKEVSDAIVNEMTDRDDVINIHSSIENTAPIVNIKVDKTMAAAEGFTASQIGSTINQMLSGTEATTLKVNGDELSVEVEYPEEEYRTIDQLKGITLSKAGGGYVALSDIAEIGFKDSPSSISKTDGDYEITISADYTGENTQAAINDQVVSKYLTGTITTGVNSRDQMMAEEFSSIYKAIAVAVFLVFVVMAAQFESPKFSVMVMTTIPFSLVGSFGLLKLTGVTISMTSLIGFLILVGTVVNNGILFVDTANHYRGGMTLKEALVEAGAMRLRPILMTSLTTILSMIPMAMGFGSSGSTTQGLAIVDIGGLTAGVLVALFMLPVYYALLSRKQKKEALEL